ncbi:hypothetical protein ACT3CD_11305 [Geofilum sp. OHC36d9]|uniref:hypothetical protein n=1 Tax=Geofilum sp. OHC36d9 TaxID=3458413 RepID=UPI004033865C
MGVKVLRTIIVVLLMAPLNLYSQSLKLGGQIGYAIPKGNVFDLNGESLSSGGIGLDLDAMYYMERFQSKFGFGLTYNGSVLFGQTTTSGVDIGIYGLNLYGVKLNYQIFSSKITPYVSLSTGVTQFSTPEIKDDHNNILNGAEKSYSFGFRPEIGLDLAGLILSAGYIVPMKYRTIEKKAGVFQLSLGIRYNTF